MTVSNNMKPTYILVATPLGEKGMGGIDRMMDDVRQMVRQSQREDVKISFGSTRGQGSILLSPFYLAFFLVRMLILKATGRIDMLHINLSSHGSTRRKIVMARWARLLNIPYIIHLHGSQFRQFWAESTAAKSQSITRMFSKAYRIVVLGNVWKSFVADRVPEAKDRILIIPNATSVKTAVPVADTTGTLRILFLGRLGARKGVPDLIKALSLISEDSHWSAIIAGNGDVEKTRVEIARLDLAHRVAVPGWVGPAEVSELLSKSDVLVLPSYDENLPMSVIEGMAAGLAIIATPVGAVEDIIIDGETGLLVPVGDADAIANAIRWLLKNPEKRKIMGANARKLQTEKLELGKYFERLVDLWTGKITR